MADASDIQETIATNAASGVKSVTVDGQSVSAHSLPELIDAEKHVASKEAMADPAAWFRGNTFRVKPPSAV